MKIDIRSQGITVSDDLREHIERCVNFGLDWAEQDVNRVVISLSDINGPRGGNDKRAVICVFRCRGCGMW